ncbi:hypothetical protein swp_4688 [Shewanella piezotolerans WP3]|uniref:Uncharacterized protein n=1 Tax=Shewanella piezotolerans (strain WP3 / JCM 13877) TaxID=225849 RepID=B8CTT0_SHEPW|nr:hypothetical protein swp_4688 [Shewanella piezotolerans WP3]
MVGLELLSQHHFIMLSEVHGTVEVPKLYGEAYHH